MKSQTRIDIRSYEFEGGILHLEREAADGLTTEEVEDLYGSGKGKLLRQWDDTMFASHFYDLENFNDL